jgi:chromosome segregation ATPase
MGLGRAAAGVAGRGPEGKGFQGLGGRGSAGLPLVLPELSGNSPDSGQEIGRRDESPERLDGEAARHIAATLNRSLETSHRHFQQVRDQLDQWAQDMEIASQTQLEDLKREILDLQRRSRQAPTLQEEKAMQDQILTLEQAKRRLRQRIFDIEDELEEKRKILVAALESRLQQKTQTLPLFTLRWRII